MAICVRLFVLLARFSIVDAIASAEKAERPAQILPMKGASEQADFVVLLALPFRVVVRSAYDAANQSHSPASLASAPWTCGEAAGRLPQRNSTQIYIYRYPEKTRKIDESR